MLKIITKEHQRHIIRKLFLSYLLLIVFFACFFAFLNSNSTFTNAKLGNVSNTLHQNDLELHNYEMKTDASYNWITSSSGQIIVLGDDDSAKIDFPFSFTFYNESFDSVYISSNGWFSFINSDPAIFNPSTYPLTNPYYHLSGALFWADLSPQNNILVHTTNQYVAIEYRNINFYGGQSAGTFEVIFYKNGLIKFQYDTINSLATYVMVGLNYGKNSNFYNKYDDLSITTSLFAITLTYPRTNTGLVIVLSVGGALLLIGSTIAVVFISRSRRKRIAARDDDFEMVYHDYITTDKASATYISEDEKEILKIQDELLDLYQEHKNKDIILIDIIKEKYSSDQYTVEEAIKRLLASKEIKGELNIYTGEFVVKK